MEADAPGVFQGGSSDVIEKIAKQLAVAALDNEFLAFGTLLGMPPILWEQMVVVFFREKSSCWGAGGWRIFKNHPVRTEAISFLDWKPRWAKCYLLNH